MTSPTPRGHSAPRNQLIRPWWGFGDVVFGILAAQVLSVLGFLVLYPVAGWEERTDVPIWGLALLQTPLWIGLAGTVVWASNTKGLGLREDFGFSARWIDVPIGLAIGVASQLILLPLIYLPLLELLDRTADDLSEPAEQLSANASGAFGWILLALVVGVGAPVVEELFYRGLVMKSLQKRGLPPWVAVLGSAGLFAAVHFQPLQFIGLFAFGLVLGALTLHFGRLGPAMWAHAAFNATTVVALYVGRN